MPVSVQESIVVAAVAVLAGMGGVPSVKVVRNLDVPANQPNLAAIFEGGCSVAGRDNASTMFTLELEIDLYAKPGADLADLRARATAALCADPTLGNRAVDLREGSASAPEIDRIEGHGPMACQTLSFEIDFITRAGDPYTPGP
jgi:hypothetical protein